jgi:molecular chaperone GrpE (heat shock protein)
MTTSAARKVPSEPPVKASASVAESSSSGPVALQEALAAQKDAYLRLAADFDNYKKADQT